MNAIIDPRSWNLDRFLIVFTALVVIVGALLMPLQSDTWWLLRLGQDTVLQRSVPTTETYSFTARGAYSPNHEWLSSVLAFGLFQLGGAPVLLAGFALVVGVSWWLIARQCVAPWRVAALILLMALVASVPSWSIRPQVITACCLVLTIVLLDHPRRMVLYPVLFLVWANLHSGVAAGGLLIAVALAVSGWRFRSQAKEWFLITTICAAMTLLNPLGWRMIEFVLKTFSLDLYRFIEEWQPQSFLAARSYPYFILLGWFLWTLWKHWRLLDTHRDWTLAVAGCIFAIMAFRSSRHTDLFALVAIPTLSLPFRSMAPQPATTPQQGRLYQLTMGALIVGGVCLVFLTPRPFPLASPVQSALRECPGPLYNTFSDGGPITWFVQDQPVFIDNRFETYPESLFHQANYVEDTGDYSATFAEYAIRCALVPATSPLGPRLRADGWTIAAQSDTHTVFYR